jgi:polyhydroxybutyrate depolymerase
LYYIRGGGHTWPGRPPRPHYLGKSTDNLDANEVIWEFFSRHVRN